MENGNTAPMENCCRHCGNMRGHGAASGAYGLGFIGALIFYIQHAATFGMGVLGVLKAMVWPAMLVYKLLEFLKM